MEILLLEATDKTPYIRFDPITGQLEITGKSIPQDAESFYRPALEWMERYVAQPSDSTVITLNLEYFNISSSKRILFILYKLNELIDRKADVQVKWHFAENDDDMKEVGQDFAFMVRVPFQFVGYRRQARVALV